MTYRPTKVTTISEEDIEKKVISDVAIMRNFELISQEIKKVEQLSIGTSESLKSDIEEVDEQDDFDIMYLL